MMKKALLYIVPVALVMFSCKKKNDDPFDPANQNNTENNEVVNNPVKEQELTTFAGIYSKILSPACGNSGCHDGTTVNNAAFPPIDFSSLEGAYSSILKQEVRKNNENATYTYIVDPGNPDGSALLGRMLDDENNPGQLMPIEVDDEGYWETNKETFIQSIRNWIAAGAPDLLGNPYSEGNQKPNYAGLYSLDLDSNRLTRAGAEEEINIPFSQEEATFYLALEDPETNPSSFTINKVYISNNSLDFGNAMELPLNAITPFSDAGRFQDTVVYTHSFRLENITTTFELNEVQFIRVEIQDENPESTTIPNNNSNVDVVRYFSFKRFNG